jgi:cytochrome c peroxidase
MKNYFPLLAVLLLLVTGCGRKGANEQGGVQLKPEGINQVQSQAAQVFGALPDKMPGSEADTPELIALGGKLYNEVKLSMNGKQSCNTCHDLKTAGVDNKAVSIGALGTLGTRNSPTVLNAGFQFVQFWDGRAKDLKEQAKGPVLNPVEMALKADKDAEKAIAETPEYKDLFAKAFPGAAKPITFDNIAGAIAAFERTLVSKSKFDFFVKGNTAAMTNEEIAGLKQFMSVGCITCHTGPLLGGSMYQKLGLLKPYKNTTDPGRFTVTKDERDKFMFKVPQLRNIALTAPYFHDGSVATLDEAVKTMADINLGKQLTDAEVKSIVTFLKALNGEVK